MLSTHHHGTASETPLLIAHGLFGSARNWGVIAKRLSDTREIITVDMRNHGDSKHLKSQTYFDMAADLAEAVGDRQMDVLGHSMGGKAAMVLALTTPAKLRHLIVADIAPVTYTHTQTPLIDAMQALDLKGISRRSEADEALAKSIPDAATRAFLLQSLDIKQQNWRLNLDALREFMPDIIGFPDITGQFDGRTLFLSGGASDYVLPAHRAEIKEFFPKALFAKIPGAGHWLHAEKPREFEAAVRAFLDA